MFKLSTIRIFAGVCLCFFSGILHSEVEQVCIDRFQANGAIPGDSQCEVLAVTSRAGLSNFGCTATADRAIVKEYCGLEESEECRFVPATAQSANSGSVSFNIDPSSSFLSPVLLQLFLISNAGLFAADTGVDPALVFAAIFGLALPVVAASDDLPNEYVDIFGGTVGSGSTEFCP